MTAFPCSCPGDYTDSYGEGGRHNFWCDSVTAKPKRRGGYRPGSGPKPKGRIKRDVSLPPEVWALVEGYRQRAGIRTRSEAVEALVRLAAASSR
jgi:hypothetical protein